MRTWGRIYGSWSLLVRFSDPLPMGSGSGDQCPKNRVIFLFVLAQLTIGYGWASMAHIWNSADLRKPLSIAKPRIHSFSAVLELILGCPQVAPKLPPVWLPLDRSQSFSISYLRKRILTVKLARLIRGENVSLSPAMHCFMTQEGQREA